MFSLHARTPGLWNRRRWAELLCAGVSRWGGAWVPESVAQTGGRKGAHRPPVLMQVLLHSASQTQEPSPRPHPWGHKASWGSQGLPGHPAAVPSWYVPPGPRPCKRLSLLPALPRLLQASPHCSLQGWQGLEPSPGSHRWTTLSRSQRSTPRVLPVACLEWGLGGQSLGTGWSSSLPPVECVILCHPNPTLFHLCPSRRQGEAGKIHVSMNPNEDRYRPERSSVLGPWGDGGHHCRGQEAWSEEGGSQKARVTPPCCTGSRSRHTQALVNALGPPDAHW